MVFIPEIWWNRIILAVNSETKLLCVLSGSTLEWSVALENDNRPWNTLFVNLTNYGTNISSKTIQIGQCLAKLQSTAHGNVHGPKCTKTHLRAFRIPQKITGLITRTPVRWGERGGDRTGRDGAGERSEKGRKEREGKHAQLQQRPVATDDHRHHQ